MADVSGGRVRDLARLAAVQDAALAAAVSAAGLLAGPGPDGDAAGWGGGGLLAVAIARRRYLDELRARAADLERERDQRAALAVAAERGRISRELHDVVAHGLSVMVIQAQGGEAALDKRPADTRAALEAIVK